MNTDAILPRLLDRLDEVADSVASLDARYAAIVDRLDRINGSVARHEQSLNETKLWQATHEQTCKPRISEATILKLVAMACGTALTLFGAKVTGLAEALIGAFR